MSLGPSPGLETGSLTIRHHSLPASYAILYLRIKLFLFLYLKSIFRYIKYQQESQKKYQTSFGSLSFTFLPRYQVVIHIMLFASPGFLFFLPLSELALTVELFFTCSPPLSPHEIFDPGVSLKLLFLLFNQSFCQSKFIVFLSFWI